VRKWIRENGYAIEKKTGHVCDATNATE